MDYLDIDGARLEVQQITPQLADTELAPIVFLHEGLGSVAMWRDWPQQVCSATGRTGWVYSRRGYGLSDPVPDVRGEPCIRDGMRCGRLPPDYMHHEAWTVLPALRQALGVSQVILLGHSDGGSIALLHASRFPVQACVVMAPHVMVENISLQSIREARRAFEGGELRTRLARYHADVDGAFWQWNDAWLNPVFCGFDIRQECSQIKSPVLAIQGEDDPYGTMQQIHQIELPASQIHRLALPQCGHSPHRDQAEATLSAIRQFLADIP